MSKKLFLGLAVAGAGVYYYDQNILPVFPRNEKVERIANKAPNNLVVTKDLQKLDTKTREFGSQLKKTVVDLADEVKQRTDSAVAAVKDTEAYNKLSSKFKDYSKDVELAAEEVENKPLPNRLAAKYIDWVNETGKTEDEKLKKLASATSEKQQEIKKDLDDSHKSWSSWWSGKKNEASNEYEKAKSDVEREYNQAKADAEKEKNSWISWGSNKKEEAKGKYEQAKADAEKEKNSWTSWGSSKKDEADKKLAQAKADAEKEKNLWVNWGSAKADEADLKLRGAKNEAQANYEHLKKEWSDSFEAGKKAAIDEYNKAKKTLDDLTQQASDKASNLYGEAKADSDNHLKKAKNDFQSALSNLGKYGSDLVDLVKDK